MLFEALRLFPIFFPTAKPKATICFRAAIDAECRHKEATEKPPATACFSGVLASTPLISQDMFKEEP